VVVNLELLMHCGSDETIANTARVSMQTGGNWYELPDGYDEGKAKKLIHYLATHKHTSPFRHTSITVRCSVPIFLARQLGKHQIGMSWNEVSRRYVDEKPTFHFPKEWRNRPEASIKQGSGEVMAVSDHIADWYEKHIEYIEGKYEHFLELGMAPEMARMILPQSMNTEFVWTGSLMAFAHVYNLRIDGHAQLEAQEFASELDKIIRPLFPVAWEALVGEPK
jgi:thymidylate synthase (FAD)